MSLAMQCSALHSSVGALSLYQGPPYNLLQVVLPIRHHFPPSKKREEGREEVMTELRAWASLQSCGGMHSCAMAHARGGGEFGPGERAK